MSDESDVLCRQVFEVYFSDLTQKAQVELLKFLGVKSPVELNLDILALATVPRGEGI